jgi:Flp pilus assembly pilin Flp
MKTEGEPGLLEYVLILLLVAVTVIAIFLMLGPYLPTAMDWLGSKFMTIQHWFQSLKF